ncbi:MAG: non-canonical purine NTP pyrophosphatase, partial [Flavobacteriales bacterium]
ELRGASDRTARFRTVICLILRDREYLFEGVVDGTIAEAGRGEGGFGYDALFIPQGHTRTFAEMDPAEKNALSHRGRAAEKLAAFLQANPTS